jgi:hypothetical protein
VTNGLHVLSDAEREPRGISIVLAGPSGIGKTFQISTLTDPSRALVIDVDRGALPLRGTKVDIVRPVGWPEIADIFCLIGGPNPSLPESSAYSLAHYEKVRGLLDVDRYSVFVVDSISQVGRESYRYAEAYPESPPRSGARDTRSLYGQHARQVLAGLQQIQRGAPDKVIILTAVLERIIDDSKRVEWRVQVEGDKVSRELPSIVDEIVTLSWISFGDAGKSSRAFICNSPNPWTYPAKDRSGQLDLIEPPHLGQLIAKLLKPAT